MECVDSFWNSGEPAYAPNCLDEDTDINRELIKKDSFQCTFFRQPKRKLVVKHGTWKLLVANPMSSSLSDIYIDSDSEVDEVVSVAQLPQIPTMCDSQYNDQNNRRPRVSFGETLCFDEDGTAKSYTRNGSTRRETNGTFAKTRSEMRYEKSNKIPNCSRTCADLYPEDFKNTKLTGALSDVKNTLQGTKRSYDPADPAKTAPSTDITRKKRKTPESRIDRNKRLLKTMEEVIRTMNEQGVPFAAALESVQSVEPDSKVAEANIAQMEDQEERGQSPKKIADDETAEQSDESTPTFIKPELEKLLDESMQRAVKKYRTGGNTWEKLKQGRLMSQDRSEKKKFTF